MNNDGIKNEMTIVQVINKKMYKELPMNMKVVVKQMFPLIEDDDFIISGLCDRKEKADIYIKIGESIKYISIKSGKTDSMHFENIKSFVLFLRSLGVSEETQKTILLFHYGDGTLDGTGERRYSFNELLPLMTSRIEKANKELNQIDIILATFYRACVYGGEYAKGYVDYFYHGNEKYGLLVDIEHLSTYVFEGKHFNYKTLHIGPMTIQPFLRDVEKKSFNQYKREMVQVKWHYFLDDLQKALDVTVYDFDSII